MKRSVLVLTFTMWATPLAAQVDTTAGPVFTKSDILRAAGFVVGVAAITPFDKRLAHYLQDPRLQENGVFKNSASFFKFMGQPAPQIIGVAMYGVGKLTHSEHLQKLAVHGVEGMLLSTAITGPIKLLAGRARPYAFHDSDAYNFKLLRGLHGENGKPAHDFQSFPSGHATTAFAVASAVAAETSEWINHSDAWPGWKIVIGATMYGGASLVGVSRMYHDQHWASDVVAGAAIGTFSGLKAVRWSYRNPHNRIDRALISAHYEQGMDGMRYLAFTVPVQ